MLESVGVGVAGLAGVGGRERRDVLPSTPSCTASSNNIDASRSFDVCITRVGSVMTACSSREERASVASDSRHSFLPTRKVIDNRSVITISSIRNTI